MKQTNIVRAPVRIDFAGGTTDIAPFTHKYGGAVLNAAINRYIVGKIIRSDRRVHLEYSGNIPTSSGLGTSGVMNLVWLALISQNKNKIELAEKVYDLEQVIGIIGGKQDQYAGAIGGINFLEFKGDKVNVENLRLNKKFVKELEDNLALVYTGKPHFAGSSNKKSIENMKKGKNVKELIRIKDIAKSMRDALLKKNLVEFSELMNQETEERKKLHRNILSVNANNIIRQGFRSGAIGAKICGSGDGGSILFFGDKTKLRRKFKEKIIDFKFDFEGLKWM